MLREERRLKQKEIFTKGKLQKENNKNILTMLLHFDFVLIVLIFFLFGLHFFTKRLYVSLCLYFHYVQLC